MNDSKGYNGWTNYETWVVNLWMDNSGTDMDAQAREMVQASLDDGNTGDDVRSEAVTTLAGMLHIDHDEATYEVAGVFADLLRAALCKVNWREIAQHYVDEVPLYCAGWNMPGYMHDVEPSLYLDADDAIAYIQESAKHAAEQDDDVTAEDAAERGEQIADWRADARGEFGRTIGGYHYFVTQV